MNEGQPTAALDQVCAPGVFHQRSLYRHLRTLVDYYHVSSLPWGPWCRQHLFDAHRLHLPNEVLAEDPIAIPQQVPWRGIPGEGFAHLLRRPLCRGMCGDREEQDATPLVCQHQKHVQDLERIVGTTKKSTETSVFR